MISQKDADVVGRTMSFLACQLRLVSRCRTIVILSWSTW